MQADGFDETARGKRITRPGRLEPVGERRLLFDREQQRQRELALLEVGVESLARALRVACVVEEIIDELEGGPYVLPESAERVDGVTRSPRDRRSSPRRPDE